MSAKKLNSGDDDDKSKKRSLPYWNSSKEKGENSRGRKHVDAGRGEPALNMSSRDFSKLLEGVLFVLSGFVNPERSTLRSQALEMGAEYRADWTSDCTLLVCAFPNTPKFRQVEADCGTIVSKEWITECHKQRKLVEIDHFLMHAGKPWRKNNTHAGQEKLPRKSHMQNEKVEHSKVTSSTVFKDKVSCPARVKLSPSKLKEWATDDLKRTISWLENQDEKPKPGELNQIAAEGILTCLEDAIMALKENKDIQYVTEQWMFVPHVVQELAKLDEGTRSLSKEELSIQALTCKRVYQEEFENIENNFLKEKRLRTNNNSARKSKKTEVASDDAGFDSDETIVMTEEEIDTACRNLSSVH